MGNIRRMAMELKRKTAWQKTPGTLTDEDYCGMIEAALRRLFVMTGKAALYDEAKITREDGAAICYDGSFAIDEIEFVLVAAQIEFFRLVQTDVNNTFGYSTDALTVTNADKPYANLAATIQELENQQRIIFYKMVRYSLL